MSWALNRMQDEFLSSEYRDEIVKAEGKHYPYWEREPVEMCRCALHCKCSSYHEPACCNDREHCSCFCHKTNNVHACR